MWLIPTLSTTIISKALLLQRYRFNDTNSLSVCLRLLSSELLTSGPYLYSRPQPSNTHCTSHSPYQVMQWFFSLGDLRKYCLTHELSEVVVCCNHTLCSGECPAIDTSKEYELMHRDIGHPKYQSVHFHCMVSQHQYLRT